MVFILFESLRRTDEVSFVIRSPEKILTAFETADVPGLLQEVGRLASKGYWAAGFVAYEAGHVFLPGMPQVRSSYPLAFFALTRSPEFIKPPIALPETPEIAIKDLSLNRTFEAYERSIAAIKREIEMGYTYQVNFTMKYRASYSGPAATLYSILRQRQRVSYAALIDTDDWSVVSLSPELFFQTEARQILMKPMKGTRPRGRTTSEDRLFAEELRSSPKEQSENLMIVDLLRNDLGKICETGSIDVINPMQVEKYETLFQMTSTVKGTLREDVRLPQIFSATFPSGSVTGAPKLKTVSIIRRLEEEPRGIYTGAIGFVAEKRSLFSVAIRTLFIDKLAGSLEMGVGSGILHEADAGQEYIECETKARFLTETVPQFGLIETMLWEPGSGYRNLELHLERLFDSADYFLFDCNPGEIRKKLQQFESSLGGEPQKVRIVLERSGTVNITPKPIDLRQTPVALRYAHGRTNSSDRFVYHKTTNRKQYDKELKTARSRGFFDVLFRNERDEITEGAVCNVYIKKNGLLFTPPISSGLLPGVYRRYLLENSSYSINEKVLYESDLFDADELYVSNAIHGLLPARLIP